MPALLIYISLPTREHLFTRLAGLNPALPPCRRRFSTRTVCQAEPIPICSVGIICSCEAEPVDLLFGCCGGYFGRFASMLYVLRKSGTTRDEIYRKQFGGSDKAPFSLSGISAFLPEAACC